MHIKLGMRAQFYVHFYTLFCNQASLPKPI
jgi:hypothetical protein